VATIYQATVLSNLTPKPIIYFTGSDTLTVDVEGYTIIGIGAGSLVGLGGQSIANTMFVNCNVDGGYLGGAIFDNCRLGTLSGIADSTFKSCEIGRSCTFGGGGDSNFTDCYMGNDTTANFDFALIGGGTYHGFVNCQLDIDIDNLTVASTIDFEGCLGTIVINNTCTAGTIYVPDDMDVTDNSGVGCTVIRRGGVHNQYQTVANGITGTESFAAPATEYDILTLNGEASNTAYRGLLKVYSTVAHNYILHTYKNVNGTEREGTPIPWAGTAYQEISWEQTEDIRITIECDNALGSADYEYGYDAKEE